MLHVWTWTCSFVIGIRQINGWHIRRYTHTHSWVEVSFIDTNGVMQSMWKRFIVYTHTYSFVYAIIFPWDESRMFSRLCTCLCIYCIDRPIMSGCWMFYRGKKSWYSVGGEPDEDCIFIYYLQGVIPFECQFKWNILLYIRKYILYVLYRYRFDGLLVRNHWHLQWNYTL